MLAELFVSTSNSLALKRLSGFTPMPSLTPQVFARAWENPSRTIPVVAEAGEGSDSLTITGICHQSPPPFLWGLSGHSEDGKSSGRDGRRGWHFLLWGRWSRKVGRSLQTLQYRVEAGGYLAQQEGEGRGREERYSCSSLGW